MKENILKFNSSLRRRLGTASAVAGGSMLALNAHAQDGFGAAVAAELAPGELTVVGLAVMALVAIIVMIRMSRKAAGG